MNRGLGSKHKGAMIVGCFCELHVADTLSDRLRIQEAEKIKVWATRDKSSPKPHIHSSKALEFLVGVFRVHAFHLRRVVSE